MKEIGFSQVLATHSGGEAVAAAFVALPELQGASMAEVDMMVRPLVQVVVELPAPIEIDPPLTAIK